jgi:hypothetical protein
MAILKVRPPLPFVCKDSPAFFDGLRVRRRLSIERPASFALTFLIYGPGFPAVR